MPYKKDLELKNKNYTNGINLMAKTQKKLYDQAIKKITNDVENKENLKKALIHEYLFRSSQSHLEKQQKEEADNIMYNILGDSEDKLSDNDKKIFYNIVENNKIKKGKGKDDIVMTKKDFVKEHKDLIALLAKVAVEGKKQEKELKKVLKGGKLNKCPKGFTTYPLTCTNWKTMKTIGRVNVDATNEEIKNDPFIKGIVKVWDNFTDYERKLLENDKKNLENAGRVLLKVFNVPEELWVEKVYKPINQKLKDTIYSGEWWKKTMSDPKTYIVLISTALKVAAFAGCGPGCAYYATQVENIGNMIVDLANGKNPSVESVANLLLGLIPEAGAYAGETAMEGGLLGNANNIKKLLQGVEGMSDARRAALVARNLTDAAKEINGAYNQISGFLGIDNKGETNQPSSADNGTKEPTKKEPDVVVEPTQTQQISKSISDIKSDVENFNKLYDQKTANTMAEYTYTTNINAMKPPFISKLRKFKDVKYFITADLQELKDNVLKQDVIDAYNKIKLGGKRSKK